MKREEVKRQKEGESSERRKRDVERKRGNWRVTKERKERGVKEYNMNEEGVF